MMFATYETLNLLWLLIPLLIFMRWAWKKRLSALSRFGDMELVQSLMEGVSREKQKTKLVLIFLVFALSLIALGRPLWGQKEQQLVSRGHDIMVALDVSRSMMAEDLKPNRLVRAKHEVANLIDRMQGNRIGLVVFAGQAFVQCPLTLDYSAAKILLSEVDQQSIPTPGTAIGEAIEKAIEAFPQDNRESRVIILITDGEDTLSDPIEAAKKAAEENVLIYSIGIGDPMGVPIPIRDENGNITEYVKDKNENVVSSKLDEETLRTISLNTGGAYYPTRADSFELTEIYEHMEQRRQQKLLRSQFVSQYEERYLYFLIPAFACLIIEMMLSDRKRASKRTFGGFRQSELQQGMKR